MYRWIIDSGGKGMVTKKRLGRIEFDVPVRIPVPDRLLNIEDQQEQQDALQDHWHSYGYSDRFTLEGITDGHFIMVRKGV